MGGKNASSIIKYRSMIFRFTRSNYALLSLSLSSDRDKSYFAPFLFTLRFLPSQFHPLPPNTNFLSVPARVPLFLFS